MCHDGGNLAPFHSLETSPARCAFWGQQEGPEAMANMEDTVTETEPTSHVFIVNHLQSVCVISFASKVSVWYNANHV